MREKKMKILNKKNLLLSSAVVAGMLFTVSLRLFMLIQQMEIKDQQIHYK